ncbi:MAG TPA: DUF1501 domain-containing protein [Gemmataceae bacterium]|jgi:uncharacterized protein (DUF1501 family)|nr:DUF1501 domain-containing protein [Gemmataceae bacterium]
MLRFENKRGVRLCTGATRRDFLRAGGLALGLSLTELASLQQLGAAPKSSEKACIQLFLLGGPSQLDTWDLKPEAPAEIRGSFRPIATNVPGIEICEHFPLMARMADRYAILRSVHHQEAPIHETGQQLLQTGYLSRNGVEHPHYGAVLAQMRPAERGVPSWVVLPGPVGNTGVNVSHGQSPGFLGQDHEAFFPPSHFFGSDIKVANSNFRFGLDPARLECREALVDAVDAVEQIIDQANQTQNFGAATEQSLSRLFQPKAKEAFDLSAEPDSVRGRYGWNTFGQSCLLARRLVERGVRLVTVNMFETVFNRITWDCHANGGDLNTTLDDYKETLCPMLDAAYAALLDDLQERSLLDSTLVLAMGEFGRTPRINARNGREHWPGVWSILMAGGSIRGGQVIGSSNKYGEEPKDRPIHPSEIAATVYRALDIDLSTRLPAPDGRLMPLIEAKPILELF